MSKAKKNSEELLDSVMNSINSEEVQMKSKWFFVAVSTLALISTIIMTVTLSVILHTIWNDIDVARTAKVLEFGSPGRAFFLRNAPWVLLLAALAMVLTVYYLINKFDISHKYRHLAPVLLIGGIILSGTILSVGGLNTKLSDNTFGRLKTIEKALEEKYVTGEIVDIEDGYLYVDSEEGELKVKVPPKNRLIGKYPELFKEGQSVKVFGQYNNDEFEAYGIIPPRFDKIVNGIKDNNTFLK